MNKIRAKFLKENNKEEICLEKIGAQYSDYMVIDMADTEASFTCQKYYAPFFENALNSAKINYEILEDFDNIIIKSKVALYSMDDIKENIKNKYFEKYITDKENDNTDTLDIGADF